MKTEVREENKTSLVLTSTVVTCTCHASSHDSASYDWTSEYYDVLIRFSLSVVFTVHDDV
jgi:hypothetical protein